MDEVPQGSSTERISTNDIATKDMLAGRFAIEAEPTRPLFPQKRPPRRTALYSAIVLVSVVVLVFAGAAIIRSHTSPTSLTGARASQPTATTQGQGAVQWIPIKSQSAGDLIAAARQSELFNVNCPAEGDCIQDLSHLGTPAFVHVIGAKTSDNLPDLYLLPILDPSASSLGVAILRLNTSHTAIMVGDIVTYPSPLPNGAVSKTKSVDAIAAVQAQRHTQPAAGKNLELVYFPIDYTAWTTGKITWTAGGQFPYDPIWLVHGADGHDYIVGTDGRVYTPQDLPLSA
jgi:hypothetical protein